MSGVTVATIKQVDVCGRDAGLLERLPARPAARGPTSPRRGRRSGARGCRSARMIHSSDVSTSVASSSFVITRSGTWQPRPGDRDRPRPSARADHWRHRERSASRAPPARRRRVARALPRPTGPRTSSSSHSSSSSSPGSTIALEAHVVDAGEEHQLAAVLLLREHRDGAACASASTMITPGMIGLPGKCPAKYHSSPRTCLRATTRSPGSSSSTSSRSRNGSRCGRIASISSRPSVVWAHRRPSLWAVPDSLDARGRAPAPARALRPPVPLRESTLRRRSCCSRRTRPRARSRSPASRPRAGDGSAPAGSRRRDEPPLLASQLRPAVPGERLPELTVVAARRARGGDPSPDGTSQPALKFPNDVLLGGRKVAGDPGRGTRRTRRARHRDQRQRPRSTSCPRRSTARRPRCSSSPGGSSIAPSCSQSSSSGSSAATTTGSAPSADDAAAVRRRRRRANARTDAHACRGDRRERRRRGGSADGWARPFRTSVRRAGSLSRKRSERSESSGAPAACGRASAAATAAPSSTCRSR